MNIAALIVAENTWLPVAMTLAAAAAGAVIARHRSAVSSRVVMAAMNLFAGVMLATMGLGHLLAVTTKLLSGTLEGSPAILYPIGIAVSLPSWLMIVNTRAILAGGGARKTTILNAWMAATLVALGLHNLPLAAAPLLNIAYRLNAHRAAGWAIVSLAVIFNLGLFIGALVFMASGQSFEEFESRDLVIW